MRNLIISQFWRFIPLSEEEKGLLCTMGCSGWWPLVANDIRQSALQNLYIFLGGTFLHCFFLRISSIYELGHLKYHKRKVKVYYCFKCKSVLWMIFILVSGWQNTFEVECWTYLLCSFVFGALCTIEAWKYLLHTLDWRLRRKYLLDLYRNVSPL